MGEVDFDARDPGPSRGDGQTEAVDRPTFGCSVGRVGDDSRLRLQAGGADGRSVNGPNVQGVSSDPSSPLPLGAAGRRHADPGVEVSTRDPAGDRRRRIEPAADPPGQEDARERDRSPGGPRCAGRSPRPVWCSGHHTRGDVTASCGPSLCSPCTPVQPETAVRGTHRPRAARSGADPGKATVSLHESSSTKRRAGAVRASAVNVLPPFIGQAVTSSTGGRNIAPLPSFRRHDRRP